MKVRWAPDNKGWIRVSCDDRIIYADEGAATDQPPHCFITNVCEPDIVKHPKDIRLVIGPVMAGYGHEWKKHGQASAFTPIQEGGITIRFRNISITEGAVAYDEGEKLIMRALQDKLIELGCDPGPSNGIASQQTRDTALSCRTFPDGTLPEKLTVATAKAFLDAYSVAGVADFASGEIELPAAGVPVRVTEIQSQRQGRVSDFQSYFHVTAGGLKERLDFGVGGRTMLAEIISLKFSLDLAVRESQIKALRACGVQIEVLKRGGFETEVTINRAMLPMQLAGTTVTFPKSSCLAALPVKERAKATFLLSHFRDIAIGVLRDKRLPDIRHEGLETFFKRVAMGEISVAGADAPTP